MIRPTQLWRTVAVAGAAGLALAACGGSNNTPATSASSAPPAASGSAPASGGAGGGKADGQLTIGTLLPQTGSLAFLGPPEFAGVDLAVKEINEAGGVLGKPIKKYDSDSGDTKTNIATGSVDRLLGNKVDAIVGAASSSVTLSVIDKITGAGVLQISPANTSEELTDYNDKNLYWRTAPPDNFQGRVIGETAIADGKQNLAILALQDSYGEGLAKSTKASFEGGGGKVVATVIYDPAAASYASEVSKIKAANPDAVALIGFDETKKIVPEMEKQGLLPKTVQVYFVDGNLSQYGSDLHEGVLEGVKGTLPGVEAASDLQTRLKAVNPKIKGFEYAPEAFDAVTLVALAAEAAKSDDATAIAGKLGEVSKGGEKCKDFKSCVEMIKAGKDIDYDGASGPIEFDDQGNPSEATMGVYQYGADNMYKRVDSVSGKVNE